MPPQSHLDESGLSLPSGEIRVLWITETYPPSRGGMAQSCDRIVSGLRERGVAVDVAHLTRSSSATWESRPLQRGQLISAPLEDDPEHTLHRLFTVVHNEHRREPYSHVVAFGGVYPIHAAPVYAAWLDAPLITLLRGNDFDAGVFSLRRRSSLMDALRASAAIAVVGSANLDRVRALIPGTVVELISNGIDATDWQPLPSEAEKAAAWRCENVAPHRRTIGLIGQLKRKKGALFLLEALATSGFADRFHVLLVGDLEPAVTEWLSQAGTEATVATSTVPFLDRYELLSLLPACDVVALPSFYDGLPNVALEAAALGIPLLASDAGGLTDLVDDSVGFRFRAGDPDECRTAIAALASTDDDDLRAKGRAALKRVTTSFGAAREIDAYAALLEGTAR